MMEIVKKTIGILWVACVVNLAQAHAADVDETIGSMAHALGGLVEQSGQFTYQVDLSGGKLNPEYNVLHHAGAIYYLGRYTNEFPNDPQDPAIRQAIVRASRFLLDRSIEPVSIGGRRASAAFSIPEISEKGTKHDAMLGTSGLSVLALLASNEAQKGSIDEKQLRSLGEFLLSMQKKNGSFYDGFFPKEGGRKDYDHSILYPGEAILGLIGLYESTHEKKWLAAAKKGLLFLAQREIASRNLILDNWGMKAAAQLWTIPGTFTPDEQTLVIRYTAQVCEADLRWETGNQTTVAGVRLEGLASALSYLPSTIPGFRRIVKAQADQDVAFIENALVKSGKYKGLLPDMPGGTFVQIDIIWHALSGLMEYRQISAMKY